jgi:hypothetical protein
MVKIKKNKKISNQGEFLDNIRNRKSKFKWVKRIKDIKRIWFRGWTIYSASRRIGEILKKYRWS